MRRFIIESARRAAAATVAAATCFALVTAPPAQAAAGRIYGCVYNARAQLVAYANIQLLLAPPGRPTSLYRNGQTNAQGCYEYINLPTGVTFRARSCNSFLSGYSDNFGPLGANQKQPVYLMYMRPC